MSGPDSPSSTQAPHSHPIPDNPLGEHFRNHHPVTFGRVVGAAFLALSLAVLNFVTWDKINPLVDAPAFYGKISGLAYNSATNSWYATQNFATYQDPAGAGLVES